MIISEALASEAATTAHEAGPIYTSPEFWVAVAFIVVILGIIKPITKVGKKAIASRTKSISDKLDEASKLKEEAETLLKEYKQKFANAEAESESIINRAKENAEGLKKDALKAIEIAMAKKEEDSLSQIKAEEAGATDEIRSHVINAGTDAAIALLSGDLKNKVTEKTLAIALHDLPKDLEKMAG